MQVEIKEIQQRLGMTVLYVTHDQEEAMSMSDRIAIINRGRIEQLGPPGEVYERPNNAFVSRFLGEANLIEGTIGQIGGGGACASQQPTASHCAHASIANRLQAVWHPCSFALNNYLSKQAAMATAWRAPIASRERCDGARFWAT